MSASKKTKQSTASRFFFTDQGVALSMRVLLPVLFAMTVLLSGPPGAHAAETNVKNHNFPLAMAPLLKALTDAHHPEPHLKNYPKTIEYQHRHWNMMDDSLEERRVQILLSSQLRRIVPHSIGVSEILWAIAPRETMILLHDSCKNPDYSFLAGQFPESTRFFKSQDAEIVIGNRPDMVLTTYFSSTEFKNRLKLSSVPYLELGYFGDMQSIQEQILFLGQLVGAPNGASALVQTMDQSIAAIRKKVKERQGDVPLKVLYYDYMGYVAGTNSTFDSLCKLLGVENVASQNGVRFFKQVDYETVLKWNPDVIIVPKNSGLDKQLSGQPILQTVKAVRANRIKPIPSVYLMASSQYAVASLNYLGGLLYDD